MFKKGDRVQVSEFGFERNVFSRKPRINKFGVTVDWNTRQGTVVQSGRNATYVVWDGNKPTSRDAWHPDFLKLVAGQNDGAG